MNKGLATVSGGAVRMRDDLEGIINRIHEEGYCSCCTNITHLVSRYMGYKIDRKLCKSCFLKGMDKLFGITDLTDADETLYKGDNK